MRIGRLVFLLLLILVCDRAFARQGVDSVESAIVRLAPSAFGNLPVAIRKYLDDRGCQIPQSFSEPSPHNIVRGRFTSANQVDTAVLCSRSRTSAILVFRGGKTADVAELAPSEDSGFVQTIGSGKLGYSRLLAIATPATIRQRFASFGGPTPPPLDHEGVDDIFVGKASVTWYWYRGRWLQLQGSD